MSTDSIINYNKTLETFKMKKINLGQEIFDGIKAIKKGKAIRKRAVKKAIDSFGGWGEREESSLEIVNKLRSRNMRNE